MKSASNATTVLLALLAAAAIGAVTLVFLILPQYNAATEARDAEQLAREDNEFIELQIQQAEALAQQVPAWEAEIALVQGELPPTAEESALRRLVVTALESAGIPVIDITVGAAQVVDPTSSEGFVVPQDEAAPDDATGEGTETPAQEEQPDPAASPTPDPSATPGPEAPAEGVEDPADPLIQFTGLVGIPWIIETEGAPNDVLAALNSLQTQNDRFFTVSNITVRATDPAEAQPGRPALEFGDWNMQITGLVFTLLDPELSFPADEPGSVPAWDGRLGSAWIPIPGTVTDE